jgi:hypothetical protein
MGFEPMNTGFADQRVSLFAIGACMPRRQDLNVRGSAIVADTLQIVADTLQLSQAFCNLSQTLTAAAW